MTKWLLTAFTGTLVAFGGILGYDAYQRSQHHPEQVIIKHDPLSFWNDVPTDANGNAGVKVVKTIPVHK